MNCCSGGCGLQPNARPGAALAVSTPVRCVLSAGVRACADCCRCWRSCRPCDCTTPPSGFGAADCSIPVATTASAAALPPAMDRVGPLHRAMAPSHFTFGSHAAIFKGFLPSVRPAKPYSIRSWPSYFAWPMQVGRARSRRVSVARPFDHRGLSAFGLPHL